MAKIWLAQGKRHFRRIGPLAERSLLFCVKKLGLTTQDWKGALGVPPQYLRREDEFESCRAGGSVIVQIENSDLVGSTGWKAGYYILPLELEAVARKLKTDAYASLNSRSAA